MRAGEAEFKRLFNGLDCWSVKTLSKIIIADFYHEKNHIFCSGLIGMIRETIPYALKHEIPEVRMENH